MLFGMIFFQWENAMNKNRIMSGLLALFLMAVTLQAAAPSLNYEINGSDLIINYIGTLLQSSDAVNWTEVSSASSPYKVTLGNDKLFFCTKGVESKDITIPLSYNVNLDLIWIKPGTFTMGSPSDELGRWGNETQHQVTLTQGYWLGKFEITQAQYEAVMGENPSRFKGADLPVESVSWDKAMEFCKKLTEQEQTEGRLPEGYEYTLPTEAQWEYACRAGTTTALNSGKNLSSQYECPEIDEVGWYWHNGGKENYENGLTCPHPVGQKKPNDWGLYDMCGNVLEWCLDWFGDYPINAVTDPTGSDKGLSRVIRGGSWYNKANYCRSAYRDSYSPSLSGINLGFRVVLALIYRDLKENITIPLSDSVDLDMVWINPGTFTMGSPKNELGRNIGETQHEVTLTEGYWLGKYEITQEQYETVMGNNPSSFRGGNLPVETVSWNDAMDFCAKLTEIEKAAGCLPEGYEYTLPTEAQWEYACRAGTTTALNNGKNLTDIMLCPNLDEVGWYWHNSNITIHPVGQKKPNDWGLYDMHGNVWEWCLDWYEDYKTIAVADPTGPEIGSNRVVRGGGCSQSAYRCRSADRNSYEPNTRWSYYGFRVVLTPIYRVMKDDITIPLSNNVNLNMIRVEPGTFIMGSPEDELGRDVDEVLHQVTLTRGYWLGRYEVTQSQYEAVPERRPP